MRDTGTQGEKRYLKTEARNDVATSQVQQGQELPGGVKKALLSVLRDKTAWLTALF